MDKNLEQCVKLAEKAAAAGAKVSFFPLPAAIIFLTLCGFSITVSVTMSVQVPLMLPLSLVLVLGITGIVSVCDSMAISLEGWAHRTHETIVVVYFCSLFGLVNFYAALLV